MTNTTLMLRRITCLVYMILLFVAVNVSAQSQDLKTVRIDDRAIQVFPADHRMRLPWGPGNTQTGAKSVDNGLENTRKIVNVHGRWVQGDYAAGVCANLNAYGHDDWYLPSRKELQALYKERQYLGGFSSGIYWSSTDDSWGGEVQAVEFGRGNYMYQPKYLSAHIRCVRQSKTKDLSNLYSGHNIQKENVIVASRYAVKSDGSKGLIFGAKFLSFFTIGATSFINHSTYTSIAQNIVKESSIELLKEIGTKALLSTLPGMDESKVRYISYAFPLKEGKQVQVDDVMILLEMADDKDLVPLNVPVELHYQPGLTNPGEPTVAIKKSYFRVPVETRLQYPHMDMANLWNRFRPTNLSSSNFRFQTFGVVDGYYTTNISRDRELTFMILKQYDNFDLAYIQTTDIVFIAVDVTQLHQYPVPGSVIHLWGEPVGLGGLNMIDLRDYSSERTSVSRYVRMDGHKLLSGIYAPANQVEQGRSVFSVKADHRDWNAVVLDLYHGSEKAPATTVDVIIDKNGYKYQLTANKYRETDDLTLAVKQEFGPLAEVADWIDLRTHFVHDIAATLDALGITRGNTAGTLIRRNGNFSYSGNRKYFINRYDGNVPSNYLVHDQIANKTVVLGSWYNQQLHVLAKYPFQSQQNQTTTPHRQEQQSSGTFTDPRDGKVYKWVRIGQQVWMAENLAFRPASGNYWAYNNDQRNVSIYGYLYDWETASRVCPPGWHLPSDAKWTQLENYVGSNSGKKLKARSGWSSNSDGTDEFGFAALPGGIFFNTGRFMFLGGAGHWWTATDYGSMSAWHKGIGGHIDVSRHGSPKNIGISVRCVQD